MGRALAHDLGSDDRDLRAARGCMAHRPLRQPVLQRASDASATTSTGRSFTCPPQTTSSIRLLPVSLFIYRECVFFNVGSEGSLPGPENRNSIRPSCTHGLGSVLVLGIREGGHVGAMATAYRRQDFADVLRRCGHPELADEALRDLPDPVDIDQVRTWEMEHGVYVSELISEMGGSP